MFVRPRAMPSFVARLRCVTRESSSTASSNLRSRCASMSMSGLPTCDRLLLERALGVGPVVEIVDADAVARRHLVRRRARAVQTGLGIEENGSTEEINGAVHRPGVRQVLAAVDPLP